MARHPFSRSRLDRSVFLGHGCLGGVGGGSGGGSNLVGCWLSVFVFARLGVVAATLLALFRVVCHSSSLCYLIAQIVLAAAIVDRFARSSSISVCLGFPYLAHTSGLDILYLQTHTTLICRKPG